MIHFDRRRLLTAAALALAAIGAVQASDGYPNQPIRLVIPYAAGGGADNVARIVAQRMEEKLGQSVVVDNRAGAGGTVAEGLVARAPADGYTVLYDTFAFAVNASMRKLPYDPGKDLRPVAMVATAPMILAVHPSVPATTLAELMALARKSPGEVSYASFGVGSSAHLATEVLAQDAGVQMLHVPYKGGAPALVDLVGGQVNAYFANASSGLPYVRSGQVRALAVSSAGRVAESGFPGFEVLDWHGLFVPRATPEAVVRKLDEAVAHALAHPDVIRRLDALGINPSPSNPEQFGQFIRGQIDRWSTLIRQRQITLE